MNNEKPKPKSLYSLGPVINNPLTAAHDWICECGQRVDPESAEWIWNGDTWLHYHKRLHKNKCGWVASNYEPHE